MGFFYYFYLLVIFQYRFSTFFPFEWRFMHLLFCYVHLNKICGEGRSIFRFFFGFLKYFRFLFIFFLDWFSIVLWKYISPININSVFLRIFLFGYKSKLIFYLCTELNSIKFIWLLIYTSIIACDNNLFRVLDVGFTLRERRVRVFYQHAGKI